MHKNLIKLNVKYTRDFLKAYSLLKNDLQNKKRLRLFTFLIFLEEKISKVKYNRLAVTNTIILKDLKWTNTWVEYDKIKYYLYCLFGKVKEGNIEIHQIVWQNSSILFINLVKFLRNHHLLYMNYFKDLLGIDNLKDLQALWRYELVYIFSSTYTSDTLMLKIRLLNKDYNWFSISSLYKGAIWAEREVWDLFGIIFKDNKDLRRILTDYGFKGHPMRKNYPLTGYIELRYDESSKRIVYEPLTLTQEYRNFKFEMPWVNKIYNRN